MPRVAILDDHPAVLVGLRRLIEAEAGLTVVAAAPSAAALATQLHGTRPDVLVLDYDVTRGDGLAHCHRIKNRPRPPAVLVYSAYASAALTLAARAAQADGVVDKAAPVRTLVAAIRRVADGGTVMPAVTRDAYEAATGRVDDTDLPVLAMLLDGQSLDAIAEALRVRRTEVAWRAQRIIGRIRPRVRARADEHAARAVHARGAGVPAPPL
jgi:DNA-binding NarL/FixJ family response regulator